MGYKPQCFTPTRLFSSVVFMSEFFGRVFTKTKSIKYEAMLWRRVFETQGREFSFQRVEIKVFGMKNILLEWF